VRWGGTEGWNYGRYSCFRSSLRGWVVLGAVGVISSLEKKELKKAMAH